MTRLAAEEATAVTQRGRYERMLDATLTLTLRLSLSLSLSLTRTLTPQPQP